MTDCLILSHIFIDKNQQYKNDIVKHVLSFYKKRYPGVYIILAGHGQKGSFNDADHVIWNDEILKTELGRGHPHFVIQSLQHAKNKGFNRICKMRAQDLLLLPDMFATLSKILNKENTKMIISEVTSFEKNMIGDLFMYSDTDYILDLWQIDSWNYKQDGLRNLHNNFLKMEKVEQHAWPSKLRKTATFMTVPEISWISLDPVWQEIGGKIDPQYLWNSQKEYLWGKKEGHKYRMTKATYYNK